MEYKRCKFYVIKHKKEFIYYFSPSKQTNPKKKGESKSEEVRKRGKNRRKKLTHNAQHNDMWWGPKLFYITINYRQDWSLII